jgi:hypothetical protein
VRNFAQSRSWLAGTTLRTRRTVFATLASAALLIALAAPPSSSALVVTGVGSVQVGVQPRISKAYTEGRSPGTYANAQGNPVVHGANNWVIYWDPDGAYHNDWQNVIDEYMQSDAGNSGASNTVAAIDSQYVDKTNEPASYKQFFRGGADDTHPYPANGCTDPAPLDAKDRIGAGGTTLCFTSQQLAEEVEYYVNIHGLPRGMNNVYYILTPPAVTVCLDGGGPTGHCSDHAESTTSYDNSFCSYHADINPGGLATGDGRTILYGVVPWTAGGLGDNRLTVADQTAAWECQDGGLNPAENEEEETTPVQQEPNQEGCPNQDGTCGDHGLADLIINQISNEQQNITTDPLLNAWQDSNHYENTDECRFVFATVLGGSLEPTEGPDAGTFYNQELGKHQYYVNDAFNYAAELLRFPGIACMNRSALIPRFTAPSDVNAGEIVSFNGQESDISLNANIGFSGTGAPTELYATYSWNFGDGTPVETGYAPGAPPCETPWLNPCAASALHAYAKAGTYDVTLTVRDVGGNIESISHLVTVVGSGGSAAPGPSGPAGAAASSNTEPKPVAAAAVLSRTLKNLSKKGIEVRYSVNEQVAGHFEVLVSRTLARKLHLSGATATGLPKGTAAMVVIAKVILVTTKGGRNTLTIKLSKANAGKLLKVKKASLMLRLQVRNAATPTPASVSLISAFTLVR